MASKYDQAAPTWGKKLTRLGYNNAYGSFLAGHTVSGGPVLDVGTGDGTFAQSWVEACGSAELTLLGPSSVMLEHAKTQFSRQGILPNLVNCGLEEFLPRQSFDAVLAAHVLEHFDDPPAGLRLLARCLTPAGRLFLVVSKPHWCNWLIWLRFRHRWFSPERVCQMAQNADLTHRMTYTFQAGPPSRTSLGYIFTKL